MGCIDISVVEAGFTHGLLESPDSGEVVMEIDVEDVVDEAGWGDSVVSYVEVVHEDYMNGMNGLVDPGTTVCEVHSFSVRRKRSGELDSWKILKK